MKEQTEMAAAHGIDGFCFHYYWFAGHRLMERPIEQYLAEKENIDFPFCLCWANENWTRRWDGSENDILMAQEHSEEDNEAVFYDLLRHFKDERYIKVNGKPMLVIYRPDIIPNINELSAQLRTLAIKEGLPGLHLVATNAFGFDRHKEVGFDAIVEFPPHNVIADGINTSVTLLNDNFSGHVFEYDDVVKYSLDRLHNMEEEVASAYYPTVMTGWDNSARKPGKGNVFHNATPAKFQTWFEGDYRWSQESHPQGAKFVFVNAWNEWAEGTYLEPDKKYGYAYLNAVRSTVNEVLNDAKQLNKFAVTVKAKKQSDSVVVAHIFYEDLVDEICDEIIAAKKYKKLDVAISIPNSFSLSAVKRLVKRLKPVKLVVSENRGRDVWPFLQTLTALKDMGYQYGCKIHSKKSTHLADGMKWRQTIYGALLSKSAIKAFEDKTKNIDCFAISSPSDFMVDLEGDSLLDNKLGIEKLMAIYDMNCDSYAPFVAGTMFWFSFVWAEQLEHKGINRDVFGPELGAIDGTIAHAFERFFTTHARSNNFALALYNVDVDNLPY
jgi:lipopolysaccharide biosynthesis protein